MQLSTAPFAALALILTVIAVSSSVSKGLALRVASIEPCGADDRRVIVVQALANGRVKIGAEDLNLSKLGDRLSVILRTRAEKLVFVTADRDRPLEEVVQLIDIASYHAEHIALLPPLMFFANQNTRSAQK
jgi:biopolymer transport protein ExbD